MSDSDKATLSERKATAAQLGRRLLRLLAPARVRMLSLHDADGELLWLSHGEFGATARRYVQDAQDAFALEGSAQHMEREVEQGGKALFFCARTPEGERSGMAFAIVSGRRRADFDLEGLRARVFASMGRFSAAALAAASPSSPASPTATPAPTKAPRSARGAAPATHAALKSITADSAPLRSRPYARLRAGGATRRYEIAPGVPQSRDMDLSRAVRLIGLIKRRGERDAPTPASFTLPLCADSVLTPQFMERLVPTLHEARLSEGMLGFCIPAAAWEKDIDATARFMEQCAAQRCFVALDDFDLARPGFALLRSSAVRCLKLDAALSRHALTDRYAHASIAAIVKAARVLGLYCVAKGVKHTATARWLATAGVEFAERSRPAAAAGATMKAGKALGQATGP